MDRRILVLAKAVDDLRKALSKAKVIVGAAVAASPNEVRPQREAVYNQIVKVLEETK